MPPEIVSTHTNIELGITAYVVRNTGSLGGFNVSLRDDDSQEFVPMIKVGIQALDDATAYAKLISHTN